jgi:hypothetical protein
MIIHVRKNTPKEKAEKLKAGIASRGTMGSCTAEWDIFFLRRVANVSGKK